jgi:DNA-binding NarL/FixJ family response regulator
MKISVLLADENKLFCELLRQRFSETGEYEVVGEAEDGDHVLFYAKQTRPDIILMDIGTPRLNGIETTRKLSLEHPECKVLALTSNSERAHIKNALNAGAFGYYLKNCTYEQLENAIKLTISGKRNFCKDVENIIIDDYLDKSQPAPVNLTKRELQIVKLLAQGKSVREISDMFFISVKTVGTHKLNILDKLGLDNLPQLVLWAIKQGIVS